MGLNSYIDHLNAIDKDKNVVFKGYGGADDSTPDAVPTAAAGAVARGGGASGNPLMQNGWGFLQPQLQALGAAPTDDELEAKNALARAATRHADQQPYEADQERQASQLTDADTANMVDAGAGTAMAARALQRNMAAKVGGAQADADSFWLPGQQSKRASETEDFLHRQEPKLDIANNKNIADQLIQALKNEGTANTAGITAAGRQNAGDSAAAINALGHVEGSGFGGRPEVQPTVKSLQDIVNSRTNQTPGVGSFTPDIEAKIAGAVKAGYSRAQAVDRLKSAGLIK